jgi:hypothetical protein
MGMENNRQKSAFVPAGAKIRGGVQLTKDYEKYVQLMLVQLLSHRVDKDSVCDASEKRAEVPP